MGVMSEQADLSALSIVLVVAITILQNPIGVTQSLVHDIGTLGLDALHDTLDGRLTEVVGVGLHGKTIDTHGRSFKGFRSFRVPSIILGISVPSCHLQHLVGDIVLAGTVAFHYGLDEIFGHIGIVSQQLFGVLGQTVAAIAEGWIVIVVAYS